MTMHKVIWIKNENYITDATLNRFFLLQQVSCFNQVLSSDFQSF